MLAVVGATFLPAAEIPRPAPEFSISAPGGKTIKLSDYKGKVVVLEILSTTCPSCQKSAGMLAKLNRELGSKGFQPLGAAMNEGADVAGFVKTYGVNFPLGTTRPDAAYAFLQHSVMKPGFYFPQLVFIDRKGVIRAQYGGADAFVQTNEELNIRNMVQKLLAESAAPTKPASRSAKPRKAS
jgi:peroxiredoxin